MTELATRPSLLYDYFLAIYEGSWLFAQKAHADGDTPALDELDGTHKNIAARARKLARLSNEIVQDDAALKEKHIALLLDMGAAIDDLIPAVRENRLDALPDPQKLIIRAQMLDNDIGAVAA
jgi:hypothetical protein